MPPPSVALTRPKDRESSNLVVMIKYSGLKATQFFSKYTSEAYKQLLSDLTDLGFPHPKRNNIVFISHGTLDFFWPIASHENSFFVTNLRKRVNLSQQGPAREEQLLLRKQLSIVKLTIREDPNYDPYLENVNAFSPVTQSGTSGPRHSHNLPTLPHKPTKLMAERYHPYQHPSSHSITNLRSNGQGHLVSQSVHGRPQERVPELLPGEMGSSLQPPVRLKSEPVDPVISPSIGTDIRVKREQLSPSISLPPTQHNMARTQSYIDLTRNSELPQSLPFPPLATAPAAKIQEQQLPSSGPPRTPFPPQPPTTNIIASRTQRVPQLGLPESPIVALPPTPVDPPTAKLLPPTPTPGTSDPLAIINFTGETSKLRNAISAAVNRHNVIIDKLQELKAPEVPSKIFLPGPDSIKNESVMRARIQELEKELDSERLKRLEMMKELEAERTKRLEMGGILKDVERECKSPFVVPGLLEAFVKIAQATTVAMRGNSPDTGPE